MREVCQPLDNRCGLVPKVMRDRLHCLCCRRVDGRRVFNLVHISRCAVPTSRHVCCNHCSDHVVLVRVAGSVAASGGRRTAVHGWQHNGSGGRRSALGCAMGPLV